MNNRAFLGAVVALSVMGQLAFAGGNENSKRLLREKNILDVEGAQEKQSFSIYAENDGAGINPFGQDRWYTSGVGIGFTHQPKYAKIVWEDLPFNDYFEKQGATYGVGYAIQQKIFTPDDTDTTALQPNDLGYGGFLYGTWYMQRATQNDQDTLGIQFGTVGQPSLARNAQNWVHSFTGNSDAQGWGWQLRQEFGANIFYQHTWRYNLWQDGPWALQVLPRTGFLVGTIQRYAHADATMRIGWDIADNFGPSRMDNLTSATGKMNEWFYGGYFFGRVGGKAVQHDIFIDGSDFRGTYVRQNSEPLVGEAQVGFALTVLKHLEVNYALTFQSKTWSRMPGSEFDYGTINIVMNW